MSISPVNLIVQKSYTNKGSKYKKSNAAKTILTTAGIAAGIVSARKGDSSKVANAVFGIVSAFAGLGAGTFVDGIINTALSAHADSFTKSSPDTTPAGTVCNFHQG
ncbi:MAG: hypothetical protein IJ877_06820 [Candidatus Gastranaerophilales bacterium]|nr:hypothetical protein [Candidatus Gastranaerophilales bacterium]